MKRINPKRYKLIGRLSAYAVLCTLLVSCDDNRLARELNGTWRGSVSTSYDDQSQERQTIFATFLYDKDGDTDGGTLVEERKIKMTNMDLDDYTADAVYHSRIEGTWEVIWGDSYIYYDVSSLQVTVNEKEVNIHWQSISQPFNALSDFLSYGYNVKTDLTRQLQKNAYSELFKSYKEDAAQAEDAPYVDLKVNGNSMSYETSDVGQLTFTRISGNDNHIR